MMRQPLLRRTFAAMWRMCLVLLCLPLALVAQSPNPGPEPIEVSGYRQRVTFTDPLAGVASSTTTTTNTTNTSAVGVDTSLRKPEVKVELPGPIQQQQRRFIERNAATVDVPGFRIQVYSGPREGANRIGSELRTAYPQQRVSVFYDAPVFKVRIGDFTTRIQADNLHRQLRTTYSGAFVVPDQVRLRR